MPHKTLIVTTSKKKYRKLLNRHGWDAHDLRFKTANGYTTDCSDAIVVWIRKSLQYTELQAVVAHEAVHVAQYTLQVLEETPAVHETLAYLVQTNYVNIMSAVAQSASKG